ncbi:MAG: hypothetical protein ACLP6W_08935 [Bryobacteraceae bacterium]
MLIGSSVGGGGRIAPGRDAALAGKTTGAGSDGSTGGTDETCGGSGATGAKVVSPGGARAVPRSGTCAKRLGGTLLELNPVSPAPKPVGLP